MKWKRFRRARRKFQRGVSGFSRTCDVDTVIVDDDPPRVVCYLLFRVRPLYGISYEESLLIRSINAPVYLVVAAPNFDVYVTDWSIPQFAVYRFVEFGDDSYDVELMFNEATWSDIKEWLDQERINSRINNNVIKFSKENTND